ncbi:MAG TPA: hypothetical protein ENJ50_11850, partial [Planctomycetaceae bacterium]|nr:hypothetical protein [Planctomycetaceae bacterium]
QAGVNYPKGPLAWADAIGLPRVLEVLDHVEGTGSQSHGFASLRHRSAAFRRNQSHARRTRKEHLASRDGRPHLVPEELAISRRHGSCSNAQVGNRVESIAEASWTLLREVQLFIDQRPVAPIGELL